MSKKKKQAKKMSIHPGMLRAESDPILADKARRFKTYRPAPGVVPDDQMASVLAMDSTPYDYLNNTFSGDGYWAGSFPGYPWLAAQAQRPEYRKISSAIAEEMTRKWIKIQATGDANHGDLSKVVNRLTELVKVYKLKDRFREAMLDDGFFGRGQIYIDLKVPATNARVYDDPDELEQPIFLDPHKITKGSLIGFTCVEPFWTYPGVYNSTNPLRQDYYNPTQWFVMGKLVNASRMLMFISRPVPDMLKAAYSFGGLSLTQVAEPYVNNWIRTRDSVGDMVHSYSLAILKTNMQDTLSGVAQPSLDQRAALFNQQRDNRGLYMVDKDDEEIDQLNTPINGLDKLQSQAQEQMCSVSSTPVVKLLGIQPAGLNASSKGELTVWYDHVRAQQENVMAQNLDVCLKIIMLSEYGRIIDGITFEFCPLEEMSDLDRSAIQLNEAKVDAEYVTAGILSEEVIHDKLASDPLSRYHSINLGDPPPYEDQNKEPESKDGPAPPSKSQRPGKEAV